MVNGKLNVYIKGEKMFRNLGETLYNKAKAVNDHIDEKKIDQLYKLAINMATNEANSGKYSVNITINQHEYDDDCPYFNFTYDSPSLMDKVVPEVMKRLNNEHIRTVLNRSPEGQVSHWILTLNFGAKDIVDNDYTVKLHPIPHEV